MQANSTRQEPTGSSGAASPVPSINPRKNAFFRYVADASLPDGAVSVTP
jgi:hypothetical protein